jgi:hypothetical protein
MKKLYLSSLSRTGPAVYRTDMGKHEISGQGGTTNVIVLSGENHNFVELGDVSEEVVHAGTFCSPPTMLALSNEVMGIT